MKIINFSILALLAGQHEEHMAPKKSVRKFPDDCFWGRGLTWRNSHELGQLID